MNTNRSTLAILNSWSLGLSEPLLSFRRRALIADDMARLMVQRTPSATLFFAGFCADMALTLPDSDPWKRLSGRLGDMVVGPAPNPPKNGAELDGKPFGTWRDSADVTPLVHATALEDPGLVALANDDLTDEAAFVVAASFQGWSVALEAVSQIAAYTRSNHDAELAGVTDIATRSSFGDGVALHVTNQACEQAARWLVHRRRSWAGPAQTWPSESAFRWAWRAQRVTRGQDWSAADVDAAIAEEKLPDAGSGSGWAPGLLDLDDDF